MCISSCTCITPVIHACACALHYVVDSNVSGLLQGTKCLAPLLHYGAHMFKMSYRPGVQHVAPPVGPAAESTVAAGRRLSAARVNA